MLNEIINVQDKIVNCHKKYSVCIFIYLYIETLGQYILFLINVSIYTVYLSW